ncbi:DUF4232 domain-containing protein [Blastococcus sp. TF02-09]|uniref:DUF4232 domain-containing protein n=1 Tax=Blastococcus sp. TF02-09 TaxID=2250576 RepID=UPI0032AECB17
MHDHERRARRHPRIRLSLVLAAVLAAGGCTDPSAEADGAATSSASGTAPSTASDSCPASGARVGVGPVDAATGERAVTLSLVNCGSAPHPVTGYPGLELLDEERQPIEVEVVETPDPIGTGAVTGPTPLTLGPGQRAQAVLLWRNTVELGAANTPGSYLAVTPSPQEQLQVVALQVDLGTTGRLTVGPWTPAT